MRAAVLEAPNQLVVREVDEPRPAAGEVLVEVELAGVCGSDVGLFQGRRTIDYPLILGHEAIGHLVTDGSRVVIEPNIPCGTCSVCRRGKGNVCTRKRSLGLNSPGVFAERVALPAEFVHPLPDEINAVDAVGIEPLAVAVHAFGVGSVQPGDRVAIIGCGTEGLLLVQVAAAMGTHVLAADIRPQQLELAARLGAGETFHLPADGATLDEALTRIHDDWGASVVFEAAGSSAALDAALRIAANGGAVVALGLGTNPISIVPLRFVRRGLSLRGSLIYDHPEDFVRTIDFVRHGHVQPSAHISHIVSLSEAADALQQVASGRPGKTVLDIGGTLEGKRR